MKVSRSILAEPVLFEQGWRNPKEHRKLDEGKTIGLRQEESYRVISFTIWRGLIHHGRQIRKDTR